jgi:hypothetical protein
MKYHIFPLAIVALLIHRKWRVLATCAAVVLSALALCFMIQGPNWPFEYAQVIFHETAAKPEYMPNLGGLIALAGINPRIYLAIAASTAVAIVAIARRTPLEFSFGIAMFAGVLVSPHGYAYDFTLLLPALLPLAARHSWFEIHAAWWLMPFPLIPIVTGIGVVGQIFLLATGVITLYGASQFPAQEQWIEAWRHTLAGREDAILRT